MLQLLATVEYRFFETRRLVSPQYWSLQFLFVFCEKTSRFRVITFLPLKLDRQNHTAADKLKYISLTSSMHSSYWDCILVLLLLHLKLLSCKHASGRSYINSAYRMENWSEWRDKGTVQLFSDKKRQIKFARALHCGRPYVKMATFKLFFCSYSK